jgi:hypothetical protein
MVTWWSWKRKGPILHRALGDHSNSGSPAIAAKTQEESGLLSIEELATTKRVRKRDKFQRNALHVAVRIVLQ